MTDSIYHLQAWKVSVLTGICLFIFGAATFYANEAVAEEEKEPVVHPENTLPPWFYFSELTVTCNIIPESGAFTGSQTGPVDNGKAILSVKLKNCRYETEDNGSGQLVADLEIDLDESADLQACNAFSLAFLFDLTALTDDFPWSGSRTLIESLEVQSLYGDTREIAFFELHDSRSGPALMQKFLESSGNYPGYVDLFWGRVVLLTSTGNKFQLHLEERLRELSASQLLDAKAPLGPPKFNLELSVRMYPPRGSCADYPDTENNPLVQHSINFK